VLGPYWRHKAAIRATMFDKQLALHDDLAQFKCCPAGRRGGKSDGIPKSSLIDLLDAGPNEAVILGAESVKKSMALHWGNVHARVVEHGLPLTPNVQQGAWMMPNGARLQFWGITDAGSVELLRGFKIRAARFDEVATYEEHLPRLVDDVLEPALGDLMGQLTLYGTPSYTRSGPWFDIADPEGARAKRWSRHHWDVRDNPHFWVGRGGGAAWLAHILESHGWEWGSALFQREYLGLFVNDASWLVVDYDRARNAISAMPDAYAKAWQLTEIRPEPGDSPESWRRKLEGRRVPRYVGNWPHVMGVDYGYNDAFSMSPLTADPYSLDRFFPWAWKRAQLTYDDAADALALMLWILQCQNVVCDPAGGGKPFYATFNRRYATQLGTVVRSADKTAGSLVESIRFQNTELRTGRLKVLTRREPRPAGAELPPTLPVLEDVLACSDASMLTDEWAVLRWKDDYRTEIREGSAYPMDCFDAGRYSLIETMAWQAKPRPLQETDAARLERQLREETERSAHRELSVLEQLAERF
jgi:hypothetical protein